MSERVYRGYNTYDVDCEEILKAVEGSEVVHGANDGFTGLQIIDFFNLGEVVKDNAEVMLNGGIPLVCQFY